MTTSDFLLCRKLLLYRALVARYGYGGWRQSMANLGIKVDPAIFCDDHRWDESLDALESVLRAFGYKDPMDTLPGAQKLQESLRRALRDDAEDKGMLPSYGRLRGSVRNDKANPLLVLPIASRLADELGEKPNDADEVRIHPDEYTDRLLRQPDLLDGLVARVLATGRTVDRDKAYANLRKAVAEYVKPGTKIPPLPSAAPTAPKQAYAYAQPGAALRGVLVRMENRNSVLPNHPSKIEQSPSVRGDDLLDYIDEYETRRASE